MASAEMTVDVTVSGVAVVRPGDTLVVAVAANLSPAEVDRFKAQVLRRLPGLDDVAVITGATSVAVYRPNPVATFAAGQPDAQEGSG